MASRKGVRDWMSKLNLPSGALSQFNEPDLLDDLLDHWTRYGCACMGMGLWYARCVLRVVGSSLALGGQQGVSGATQAVD